MARTIYVNLPVKDVEKSREFFGALGFEFNAMFSDEHTAAMVVEENIVVMLLEEARFKDFLKGEMSDAHASTEVLLALSADTRAEVDTMIQAAVEHGGSSWKDPLDEGGMYGGSFQDIDGHVWELVYLDAAIMTQEPDQQEPDSTPQPE